MHDVCMGVLKLLILTHHYYEIKINTFLKFIDIVIND